MQNQENKRNSENEKPYFRSGRFYSIANEWYFSVRENQDQGPFPSKAVAEDYLKTYLMDYTHLNTDKESFDFYNMKIN